MQNTYIAQIETDFVETEGDRIMTVELANLETALFDLSFGDCFGCIRDEVDDRINNCSNIVSFLEKQKPIQYNVI